MSSIFAAAIGGTAGLALAVSLWTSLGTRVRARQARELERRLAESSVSTDERLEGLVLRLEDALAESQRSRQLVDLARTLDPEMTLRRTLELALELSKADGVAIELDPREGERAPALSALGLSPEELGEIPLPNIAASADLRAIRLEYLHGENGRSDSPIRSGLAIPLRNGVGDPVGAIVALWRQQPPPLPQRSLDQLDALAASAGPALSNAHSFRTAKQLADLDPLTQLHNRRYFHETLTREVTRAQRYGRDLALVVLDLDNFKPVNDRVGHLAGDAVLAEVAERIRFAVRGADVACRVGGDEFAVILPESTLFDAEQLYQRLRSSIALKPCGDAVELRLSAGVAELRLDEDSVTLFERADEALYRAKAGGRDRAVVAGAPLTAS